MTQMMCCTFWSEDAGVAEDPTKDGINPELLMKEICSNCLTTNMMWSFRDAPLFKNNTQEYLNTHYSMYTPVVIGEILSSVNMTSFCSQTFVGKYRCNKGISRVKELSNKYGIFVIRLKEVNTIYNYIWIPFTMSLEGRGHFLSSNYDTKVWETFLNECISELKNSDKHVNYNNLLNKLVVNLRPIVEFMC